MAAIDPVLLLAFAAYGAGLLPIAPMPTLCGAGVALLALRATRACDARTAALLAFVVAGSAVRAQLALDAGHARRARAVAGTSPPGRCELEGEVLSSPQHRAGTPRALVGMAAVADEVMQAVRAFVNAPDWPASRQVVEAHQATLFTAEVEALFAENIGRARDHGDQRTAELLTQHLHLLRACQAEGIAAAFARLVAEDADEAPPVDPELISRSITALCAGQPEKLAYARRLQALAAGSDDQGLKDFVTALQSALFGGNLSRLGASLRGPYAAAWQVIVDQLRS